MAPPHEIDTKNPSAVAEESRRVFGRIGAGDSRPLIDRLFRDVTDLFEGRYPGYRAIDMRYHDYEHTLQATVCLLHILEGRNNSGDAPRFNRRDHELALMAVLLHDSGYLKTDDDPGGTGAKYTLVHVARSCEFARKYLPGIGVASDEIADVTAAISCTGPANRISNATFRRPEAHLMACILVTADYLGQMAAGDYVDELPILYREFEEAYDFAGIPSEQRVFHSERELVEKTPFFWERLVVPLLHSDAANVSRYLELPDGTNPYFAAVDANIAEVRRRLAADAASS